MSCLAAVVNTGQARARSIIQVSHVGSREQFSLLCCAWFLGSWKGSREARTRTGASAGVPVLQVED